MTNYSSFLIEENDLLRTLPVTSTHVIDFSSNDYLGLSQDPDVLHAAYAAGKKYGVGATGSRLLSGNNALITTLESRIAHDKHTETALIFPSGYQANISVLSSLLFAYPNIFFHKRNHASLYDALGNRHIHRYRDHEMLEKLLEQHAHTAPKIIVTETVFGMDGDVINLPKLLELAKKHHAFLYLDEAHGTGLFGPRNYGVSTTTTLHDVPHVIMGTFSKALGAQGGYVACSNILKTFILNRARGFIYTTAPSPLLLGALQKSWEKISSFSVTPLFEKAHYVREQLCSQFEIPPIQSPIVPLLCRTIQQALNLQKTLAEHRITVAAIRPPTVPTPRLRIALSLRHTWENVHKLVTVLKELSPFETSC